MNTILDKLRSGRGASISFALLLFLVCAVISSIVLVAGTSAAGRLSGMAKAEQRYYSVASTAKLIRDLMEGESVTVIQTDDGDTYIVFGSSATQIDEVSMDTLPKYTVSLISSHFSGNVEMDLTSNGDLADAVTGLSVTEAVGSNNVVTFLIKKDGLEQELKFATIKKQSRIEISSGDDTIGADKIKYSWKLSKVGIS